MSTDEKRFPIQKKIGRPITVEFSVPWVMAERAYENYARRYGSRQSLERLAERNGFGWAEFALLYCDQDPSRDYTADMVAKCTQVVVVDLLSGVS